MKIDNKLARYMELSLLVHWDYNLTETSIDMLLDAMDNIWFQLTEQQIAFLDTSYLY